MRAAWAGILVATLVGAAGCSGSATPRSASSPSGVPTTATPSDSAPPLAPYVRAAVSVGSTPAELTEGFGSVWVVCHRGAEVDRIDPRTGRVAARVHSTGSDLIGAAAGAGHVWYLDGATQQLEGIDPSTNRVVLRVPVASDGGGVTASRQTVWFAGTAGQVVRVGPTGRVLARKALAPKGSGLSPLLVGNRLWVADPDHGTLYGLDASTLDVRVTRHLKGDPGVLAYAFGSLWVGDYAGPLFSLDPVTGAVRRRVPLSAVDHLAVGPSLLWVRVNDTELDGLDPATGAVRRRFANLPTSEIPGGGVLWHSGDLWVVNWSDGDVYRIPDTR